MAPDLPADPPRCPACAAAVRPDAPWCTQCWLDLRTPAPAPVPVDVPVDGTEPAGWPCSCGARNPVEDDACAACWAGLFTVLRSGSGAVLAVPVLGDVAGLSNLQLALAAGALLPVLVALLLAALALAGAVLT